jgi:hypothetical protein
MIVVAAAATAAATVRLSVAVAGRRQVPFLGGVAHVQKLLADVTAHEVRVENLEGEVEVKEVEEVKKVKLKPDRV